MIYVFILCYVKSRRYFVLLVFSTRVYAFVECFRNIQVDSVVLLSTLATIDSSQVEFFFCWAMFL